MTPQSENINQDLTGKSCGVILPVGSSFIMEEIWKDIPGYEGYYQCSSLGQFRRVGKYVTNTLGRTCFVKGRMCNLNLHHNEYYRVSMSLYGKAKWESVHRLIALTFIPNPKNLPEVNHKDCNKTNNQISNLEWVTKSENSRHSLRHGRTRSGERSHYSKLTWKDVDEIKDAIALGEVQRRIAEKYNVSYATICNINRNKKWQYRQ